jgi:hypothetical protein
MYLFHLLEGVVNFLSKYALLAICCTILFGSLT